MKGTSYIQAILVMDLSVSLAVAIDQHILGDK